jgi:DNA invertase Pin-like site-specific DNA recombinase
MTAAATQAPRRAALYLRVSTAEQTTANQRLELERVAAARGWQVVGVFEDPGVSGAKGRDKRPGFDKVLKAGVRGEYDVLMAWSVDRLGRSLQDLVAALSELNGVGRNLYLHTQALDTTTPSGRAMFQMLGVFAEFERCIITERVNAGIARARVSGTKSGKPHGRPALPEGTAAAIRTYRARGESIRGIARELKVSTATVQKVLGTPGAAAGLRPPGARFAETPGR